jgi:hypothetical protein
MDRRPIAPDELHVASNPGWPEELARGLAGLATSGKLRPATAETVLAAVALVRRDMALRQLVSVLDPAGTRSKWSIATEVEARLAEFTKTRWPSLRYSDREPGDRVERLLLAVMRADGPRCARRLADLL